MGRQQECGTVQGGQSVQGGDKMGCGTGGRQCINPNFEWGWASAIAVPYVSMISSIVRKQEAATLDVGSQVCWYPSLQLALDPTGGSCMGIQPRPPTIHSSSSSTSAAAGTTAAICTGYCCQRFKSCALCSLSGQRAPRGEELIAMGWRVLVMPHLAVASPGPVASPCPCWPAP